MRRDVTGCKVGTSHQELYRETDELSLEERRKKSRMNKLYEVLKEDRSCRLNRGRSKLWVKGIRMQDAESMT